MTFVVDQLVHLKNYVTAGKQSGGITAGHHLLRNISQKIVGVVVLGVYPLLFKMGLIHQHRQFFFGEVGVVVVELRCRNVQLTQRFDSGALISDDTCLSRGLIQFAQIASDMQITRT